MDRDEDPKPRDSHADGEDRERHAHLSKVREESHQHGETESGGPGRDGVELSLDSAVVIRLDNAGGEVSVTIRRDNQAKIHEAPDNDLVVLEDVADILEGDGPLTGGTALVSAEPGGDVRLLVRPQPLGFLGEIREQEEEEEGDEDCEAAF